MENINLTEVQQTANFVSHTHFGGNVVFNPNTNNGVPKEELQKSLRELDIGFVRYPGGQPEIAYADGILPDGKLPSHLTNYLTAARDNGQSVVIVTPIDSAYDSSDDYAEFTRLIIRDFGDVLHAFEIGNEYWGQMSETEYGQIADETIRKIQTGLDSSEVDVPIWIQMGDAGGKESEFYADKSDQGWIWRNILANETILDQLSDESKAAIDGVVEHYYFRDTSQYIGGQLNDQNIGLDYEIWKNALNDEITLNITEWNIRTTNLDQLGIKAASTLVAQFSHMVEMGVDEAFIWAPMHNTSTDLAGSSVVIQDDQTGVVINSVGGAIFDLMSSSLPGLEYMQSSSNLSTDDVDYHVYANGSTAVVYLSSRSNAREEISFNVKNIWENSEILSAIRIGYDHSSSNGKHFDYKIDQFVNSDFVMIDGERYYTNEHDVRASVELLAIEKLSLDGDIVFTLMPYEVVEITYELPQVLHIRGTNENDLISSKNSKDEYVHSYGGADVVRTDAGSDTIKSYDGEDYVDAGSGADLLYGGDGNDVLRGRTGSDTVYGGQGNDDISGGYGRDFLWGGEGSDSIDGGAGNDILRGLDGDDTIIGGAGADLVHANGGDDFIHAGRGSDSVFGGNGNQMLLGGRGDDVIDGQKGDDTLIAGYGDDTLKGGNGADTFIFDTENSGGNNIVLDFSHRVDELHFVNLAADDLRISKEAESLLLLWDGGSLRLGSDVDIDTLIDSMLFL